MQPSHLFTYNRQPDLFQPFFSYNGSYQNQEYEKWDATETEIEEYNTQRAIMAESLKRVEEICKDGLKQHGFSGEIVSPKLKRIDKKRFINLSIDWIDEAKSKMTTVPEGHPILEFYRVLPEEIRALFSGLRKLPDKKCRKKDVEAFIQKANLNGHYIHFLRHILEYYHTSTSAPVLVKKKGGSIESDLHQESLYRILDRFLRMWED